MRVMMTSPSSSLRPTDARSPPTAPYIYNTVFQYTSIHVVAHVVAAHAPPRLQPFNSHSIPQNNCSALHVRRCIASLLLLPPQFFGISFRAHAS